MKAGAGVGHVQQLGQAVGVEGGALGLDVGDTALLFQAIPKGFFPSEDIGQIQGSTIGPDDASFDAMVARAGM